MYRPTSAAALLALSLTVGCASLPHNPASSTPDASSADNAAAAATPADVAATRSAHALSVAHTTEVPVEKNAPATPGHPLTSVVVTQCNLIVAVYLTMPDGRLLRFDKSADVPADQLLSMAYTAARSERVEVSCEQTGAVGYEHHEPL